MKRLLLLTAVCFFGIVKAKSQVILNEIYTDPGAGKEEFFELYNTSGSTVPMSLDDYSIVTFFELSGKRGFYVLDLPNLTINPQGFFVGSSSIPFDCQSLSGSTSSNFSWNDAVTLAATNGYLKKWQEGTANLADGNPFYDEAPLPANFNDFFYRRTAAGASYSIFVYKEGQLVNTFIGGTGGNTTVITAIVTMPDLNIDMVNPLTTDYSIDWSVYNIIPLEYCTEDAGSDNGYIRERDGGCGLWDKSSAGVQHTPQTTNGGKMDAYSGTISVSSIIVKGTPATGSYIDYEVVGATAAELPVELMVYIDNGTTFGTLDPADTYVTSSFQYAISAGKQTTPIPYGANAIVVVKSAAGCIDKIQFLPNVGTLAVNLTSFQGNKENNSILLGWTVQHNEDADRYVMERSLNGTDFTPISILMASNKIGTETYAIYDKASVTEKVFYRIKIYTKDQKFEYSRILVFQQAAKELGKLAIINNPATDKLTLHFTTSENQPTDISVYDLTGRKVMTQRINAFKGSNLVSLPLPATIKSGIYIAEVTNTLQHHTSKFIKQ